MLFTRMNFIGIDPTTGNRPIVFAAIDDSLTLQALGQGSLEEVVAYVAGQQKALAAICAPRQPNTGLMARDEYRQNLSPEPSPGRWLNFRMCEYQLRLHNLHIPRTPRAGEKTPGWMRNGYLLFQRLGELGYQPSSREGGNFQTLEVYPHASYSVLLGRLPFPKNTLEGRLQRQLILFDLGLNVPDPMRFFEEVTRSRILRGILPAEVLLLPRELDALVGAYTAWLWVHKPGEISKVGDSQEGEIILPARNLKQRYS
jgi:hypothetical protein